MARAVGRTEVRGQRRSEMPPNRVPVIVARATRGSGSGRPDTASQSRPGLTTSRTASAATPVTPSGTAWTSDSGLLWALAPRGDADVPHGLCRVDAALVDGRQVARAVPVASLADPTALVCLARGDVIVAEGSDAARVVRFAPTDGGEEKQR